MKKPKTATAKKATSKTLVKLRDRTAQRKKLLLEALTGTRGIVTSACASIGIDRQSYYNWMASDPDFASAVAVIKEEQIDFVETNLLERINEGDTTATIFYLKTKGKERGYTERTEITGKDGKDLVPEIRIEIVDANHSDD